MLRLSKSLFGFRKDRQGRRRRRIQQSYLEKCKLN